MNAYLYVLNTLADWEVGYITAELNSGRFLDPTKPSPTLMKIGNTLAPITTMGGMTITPEVSINNVLFHEGDLLILPGADTWLEDANTKILEIVSDLLQNNVIIAAICGATIALAHSGLLNQRYHTSNDKALLTMMCPDYAGEAYYVNQPVVTDQNVITASGLAPLDFSYEVFKHTQVMRPDTLEAWYQLYTTKEPRFFFALMESLNA
jgi:putative intracellular protease/amidase